MDLSGIQIFKYLPGAKKLPEANCKKCGFPTCMAFALKLAQKQTTTDKCEHVPQELKDLFENFSKKQQNLITYGNLNSGNPVKIGAETVIFRHEKTFVNKTSVAIKLDSNDPAFDEKLEKIAGWEVERVGEIFKIDAIYLVDNGNLIETAQKVATKGLALIAKTADTTCESALSKYNPIFEFDTNQLLNLQFSCLEATSGLLQAAKTEDSIADKIAPNLSANIVVEGKNIDDLAKNSAQYLNAGFENLILTLDNSGKSLRQIIEEQTNIRRLAILNRDKLFAHPVLTKIFGDENIYEKLAIASFLLCRYSNILVLDVFDAAMLTTLFTLRQNIYTDPQKPLQVESKVYEINSPDTNSQVFLTTNFALTYFAVANELESANYSCYLVVTPSDGMSVLTAWSADKFTAEIVGKTVNNSEILKNVKNKQIIIPGLLSHMEEELAEVLPDWKVVSGPKDACDLPDFITQRKTGAAK